MMSALVGFLATAFYFVLVLGILVFRRLESAVLKEL